MQNNMIDAPLKTDKIKKIYNTASQYYSLSNLIEKKPLMRGIEAANIKPNDKVLEVAVGLGFMFLEILRRVNRSNVVYGIDLSPKMLDKARRRAVKSGFSNFDLREADVRHLPYPDKSFDVLFNSYMLDLMPFADFPIVLKEYYRVLKRGGRLVLVNFSKEKDSPVIAETLYKLSPSLWHGCRPVLMESSVKQAGFKNVKREFPKFHFSLPSEIVTGVK